MAIEDWKSRHNQIRSELRKIEEEEEEEKRKLIDGNIFVKGLDISVTSLTLFEWFAPYGLILSCKVAMDANYKSKGYGFVQFDSSGSTIKAIGDLNGSIQQGNKIWVGPFVAKKERERAIRVQNINENGAYEERENQGSQSDKISIAPLAEINPFGLSDKVDEEKRLVGDEGSNKIVENEEEEVKEVELRKSEEDSITLVDEVNALEFGEEECSIKRGVAAFEERNDPNNDMAVKMQEVQLTLKHEGQLVFLSVQHTPQLMQPIQAVSISNYLFSEKEQLRDKMREGYNGKWQESDFFYLDDDDPGGCYMRHQLWMWPDHGGVDKCEEKGGTKVRIEGVSYRLQLAFQLVQHTPEVYQLASNIAYAILVKPPIVQYNLSCIMQPVDEGVSIGG